MDADGLDRLAQRQHGVVSHDQLLALGVDASAIARRRRSGSLVDIGYGVYRLVGTARTWRQAVMAATLAPGERWASHRCAAAFHLLSVRGGIIETVGEGHGRTRRPGVKAHVTNDLPAADRWISDGVPVTAIDRTLIDVGRYWPHQRVGELLDLAVRDRLTTYEQFSERVAALARRGRNGIGVARLVLEARGLGDGWGFEGAMLTELGAAGLEPPVREFRITVGSKSFYVDFAYPEARLGIECDSTMWHTLPHQFEADLERQNAIQSTGFLLLRYTPNRLRHNSAGVTNEIRKVLATRRSALAT